MKCIELSIKPRCHFENRPTLAMKKRVKHGNLKILVARLFADRLFRLLVYCSTHEKMTSIEN